MEQNSLWVQKYNPKTLSECVLPLSIKREFESIIESGTIPNLLLAGDAGMGKTTVAKLLVKVMETDYLFMNASDDRGIEAIKNKISSFATTSSMFGDIKVMILDEADNLTPDAQKALRGMIEETQHHCRFILTANYPHKLIAPLRSRMKTIEYRREDKDEVISQMTDRLKTILTDEGVEFADEDVYHIVKTTYPDYRSCLNLAQNSSLSGTLLLKRKEVATIEELIPLVADRDIANIVKWTTIYTENGGKPTQIAEELTERALTEVTPTQLPILLWSITQAEVAGTTDEKRATLNIVFAAMEE